MAYDKAVDGTSLDADLTAVADAIRTKGGTTDPLVFPEGFVTAVGAISGGGNDTADRIIDGTVEEIKTQAKKGSEYALAYKPRLRKIFAPELTNAGNRFALDSKELAEVVIPEAVSIEVMAFAGTSALARIDLPKCGYIGRFSFSRSGVDTIILRWPEICKLESVNAFEFTPIASGTGYVYVPKTLVEQYKTATNWVTYDAQIRAIEDYPDITGG